MRSLSKNNSVYSTLLKSKLVVFLCCFLMMPAVFGQMTANIITTSNTNCNGTGCNYSGPTILINEIMLCPTTNDGSSYGSNNSQRGEWIELYNPDLCQSIDISCYYLGNNTSDGGSTNRPGGFVIPQGTIVPPSGFVIIRGSNAPAVASNLLIANGGNTIEIVLSTATGICIPTYTNNRLWFPNAGGWFAFYDDQGIPQDAVSWATVTTQNAQFPCVPPLTACNPQPTSLASYNQIPVIRKNFIGNGQTAINFQGQSYRRIPDGSNWSATPSTPTMGFCNATCILAGSSTCAGTATANITGGTAPYTYLWNDSQAQITQTALNLCTGNYTVTVTDATGLSTQFNTFVPAFQPSLQTVATSALCYGDANGSIDLTVVTGTPSYNYAWSNSSTVEDQTNLVAGNYIAIVMDANGCYDTITTNVGQPPGPLNITAVTTNVSCFGGNTGSLNITASGGTPNYSYLWNNSSTLEDQVNLVVNQYSVSVTDANGCNTSNSFLVTQPTLLISSLAATSNFNGQQISCFSLSNGSIGSTTIGGVPPYTYLWNNAVTTSTLSNIPQGNYLLQVTDSNGCISNPTITITQPTLLVANASVTSNYNGQQISCFNAADGTASVSVIGGTQPYSYLWSNGQTTATASGLTIGTYTVTVTDVNGCVATSSVTLTQPTPIVMSSLPTDVLCFGGFSGFIDLTTSGGTFPYSYAWSNGATMSDVGGLAAGTYNVVVTDINGCTQNLNTTVVQPALPITPTQTHIDVACYGDATGSIDLSVSGGTPGYTYNWSTAATTQDISGLPFGIYSVFITDNNACLTQFSVIVNQPTAPLSNSAVVTPVGCLGQSSGAINMGVSGGTPPYTYAWSNGATIDDISGLPAGVYGVIVYDFNNLYFKVLIPLHNQAPRLW